MVREFCPKCRTIQTMNSSDWKKTEMDKDNKTIEITARSYHCSACHIFVRGENIKTII